MQLAGQFAWVTGSVQRLGEAIAWRLAQEECRGLTLMCRRSV